MIVPRTRRRTHEVVLTEVKCVICGKWEPYTGQRPRKTCSPSCRMKLHRGTPQKFYTEDKKGKKRLSSPATYWASCSSGPSSYIGRRSARVWPLPQGWAGPCSSSSGR